jgi:hypothetical protein
VGVAGAKWKFSDLVILVPMLGRPHHVDPLLATIRDSTPGCRVLFVTTPGDVEVEAAIDATDRERIEVKRRPIGDYARKVNAGYRHTTEPLLFTGASDLAFRSGWFEAATAELTPEIGVVGTNDDGNPLVTSGKHATHFLVTREYADACGTVDGGPGAIFAEVYPHEFVDNEMIGTAKYRGAYAMALDSHVTHLHPHWFPSIPSDEGYDAQPGRMSVGRAIYGRRCRQWGGR